MVTDYNVEIKFVLIKGALKQGLQYVQGIQPKVTARTTCKPILYSNVKG